jgi:hypothetical protein
MDPDAPLALAPSSGDDTTFEVVDGAHRSRPATIWAVKLLQGTVVTGEPATTRHEHPISTETRTPPDNHRNEEAGSLDQRTRRALNRTHSQVIDDHRLPRLVHGLRLKFQ